MAKISNLKDKQGNILYPITSTSALVDSNGQQFQPAKQGDSYTKSESDGRYVTVDSLSERLKTIRTWRVGYESGNSSKGWYKFLTFNWNGSSYVNYDMHILVSSTFGDYFSGMLHLNPRWDTTSLSSNMCVEWDWLSGDARFTADSVKVVRSDNKVECYIYQPIDGGWHFISFTVLHETPRHNGVGITWNANGGYVAPLPSVSNVWITSKSADQISDANLVPSALVGGGYWHYAKCGRVVFVIIQDMPFTTTSFSPDAGALILSGLPKPKAEMLFLLGQTTSSSNHDVRVKLTTDGTIVSHYSNPGNTVDGYFANFCYITAE